MKKIQCTFRLPENVVNLIDEQEGETRTEKLLNLLNINDGVMQGVIKNELQERLIEIETRLSRLEKKKVATSNSSNQKRKKDTIEFIQREISQLSKEQIEHITTSRYALSELRKVTKITKSQCDSYADMIKESLGMKAA
ncbi:hypothetical protein ACW0W9_004819 [Vibrio parahaemolyticus]